jgi:hypothetical protein
MSQERIANANRAGRDSQLEERWARYGIFVLAFYATARAVIASASKPLWFDEITSWIIAHQPNLAAMWAAIRRGADSQGPVFDLVERGAAAIPNAEVGLRLPSAIGFACVMVCLFLFVRRRSSGVYGLISAGVAMVTTLYRTYAIEARSYSLVAACIAIALVAYQRAPARRWVVLLALALAGAESLHYYAIFAVVCFAAAECVFFWKTSNVRLGVWASLSFGALPLAVFWPILVHFRAVFGKFFGNSGFVVGP